MHAIQKENLISNERFWQKAYGDRGVNHPAVQVFARQRVALLQRYLPLQEIQRSLDVGCGSGFSSYEMKKVIPHVVGVDFSPSMLCRNPLYPGAVVRADARWLPFPDHSFDLVYAWELLHHFPDPLPLVQEMSRVSRKWVVIFDPSRYHPVQMGMALLQKEHRAIVHFSSGFLCHLLREAGLRCILLKRVGWIFPNKTPVWLLPFLKRLPVESRFGISYLAIGVKE